MATVVNQQVSSNDVLKHLTICPGHQHIDSSHPSRKKAKDVGFEWLGEKQNDPCYMDCDIAVSEGPKNVHTLTYIYKHQNIDSCPNPHAIVPYQETACSGHSQTFDTYETYEHAKKKGFEWLDEQQKDTHYTDCKISVVKEGKRYKLIQLYKHQNLDSSSNLYLRFPCQILTCVGHSHLNSIHSTEKKAKKKALKCLNDPQINKNFADYKTSIIRGPKKNYALVTHWTHPLIDNCPNPHPILPGIVSCSGHSLIHKTHESREDAKKEGFRWLEEKKKDSHYKNCDIKVDRVCKNVHDLICYFEHTHIKDCSNPKAAFKNFKPKPSGVIGKAGQFFNDNRQVIITTLALAGLGIAVTQGVFQLALALSEANDFDAVIRKVANSVRPITFTSASSHTLNSQPNSANVDTLFQSSNKDMTHVSEPQESLPSSTQLVSSPQDTSYVELTQPTSLGLQNLVTSVDAVATPSIQTPQDASPTQKSNKAPKSNKLRKHVYEPIKRNVSQVFNDPVCYGTLQAIGGAFEIASGGLIALGTYGAATPLGGAIMFHGSDQFMSGLQTALKKKPMQTTTTQLLQKTGLSHSKAVFIDDCFSFLGPGLAARLINNVGLNSYKLLTQLNNLRVARITASNQKVFSGSQKVGLSVREMFKLKEAGQLNGRLHRVYKNSFASKTARESFELFQRAEKTLKPYTKKAMSEVQIRKLIQSTGIKTYARPKGIPKDFKVYISKKGGGIVYVDPLNPKNTVRVMPGKPHSPWPYQQKPYIIQIVDGKYLDVVGSEVLGTSIEAHIPIQKFNYKDNLNVTN